MNATYKKEKRRINASTLDAKVQGMASKRVSSPATIPSLIPDTGMDSVISPYNPDKGVSAYLGLQDHLSQYDVPEELLSRSLMLKRTYQADYDGFVSKRKPFEPAFVKELDAVLQKLGYKKENDTTYVRPRKENTSLDVLVLNDDSYLKYQNMSEDNCEVFLNPARRQDLVGIKSSIVGTLTGIAAEIALFAVPAMTMQHPIYVILPAGILQGFVSLMTMNAVLEDGVDDKWLYRNTFGYLPGLGVAKLVKKLDNKLYELGEKFAWKKGSKALENALKPAKGFTYSQA
ncbi:hypothetical protein JW711_00840 [Candidatus Woesearchaeota archaeon]|nr:hypothetical protein [Candidatus Woesearchaeota archaeon]